MTEFRSSTHIRLDHLPSKIKLARTLGLVLVTSRRRLTGLDNTQPLSLDVLPPCDAIALLTRVAGKDRLAGEPTSLIERAADLCGRLPLAIRIAAARLHSRPTWTLAYLVDRLLDERQRLSELEAGPRSVAAAFRLSYQQLDPDQQRMFRLLGLHPGPDIDIYASAALADNHLMPTRRLLDQLLDAHLLQETLPGRFAFHDLVRAHAAGAAADEEAEPVRHAALTRLLDHYRRTASIAMNLLYPYERERRPVLPPADTPTPAMSDPSQASGWLDTELPNLLAAARHAADHGWPDHALHLSATLHRHLRTRGRNPDAETLHTRALEIARAAGNHTGELEALIGLGHIHRLQGRREQAIEGYTRALEIARAAGNHTGELDALTGRAHIHRLQGRYEQATEAYQQALEIAHATGHHTGELDALSGLGLVYFAQGRYEQSTEAYQQELEIAHASGIRSGELDALRGLGDVHWAQGRYEQATETLQQALEMARATGYRHGELGAMLGIGHVYLMQGSHDLAADSYQRAFDLAVGIGDPNWQFEAAHGLGRLRHAAGHPELAITHLQHALVLATELGQLGDEARAHDGLAHAHHSLHQPEPARQNWQRALEILTSLGIDRTERGEATTETLRTHLANLS